jgi:hypothetical protein
MEFREETTIECPFCSEKTVRAVCFPPTTKIRRSRSASAGTKIHIYKISEKYLVVSDCSNCGKTKKEIERALKEGKQPSNEEIIKRIREAGLDPTKLK